MHSDAIVPQSDEGKCFAQPLPTQGKVLRIDYEFDDDIAVLRVASVP